VTFPCSPSTVGQTALQASSQFEPLCQLPACSIDAHCARYGSINEVADCMELKGRQARPQSHSHSCCCTHTTCTSLCRRECCTGMLQPRRAAPCVYFKKTMSAGSISARTCAKLANRCCPCLQANNRSPREENVAGSFFVDHTCIDCDTCRLMAPETFSRVGEQSAVHHQPTSAEGRVAALQALFSCPT
jgi:ferredoxin